MVTRPVVRRGAGRYDVLLAAVAAALLVAPFATPAGRPVVIAMLTMVLAFAMWTSGAGGRVVVPVVGLAIAALVVTLALQPATGRASRGLSGATEAALCAATIATMVHALIRPRINARTLAASLAVYLLLGMMFSAVYRFIDAVHGTFFVTTEPVHTTTYLYFSLITLTTVGFGDYVPASQSGQMLAALEALIGQLYLVTVVAVVVSSRMGRRSH